MRLVGVFLTAVGVGAVLVGVLFGLPALDRYQKVANARNEIQVNDMKIGQTKQLVEVERQKAQIKIQEAYGLAESQRIVNSTLTPLYIQHEAIQAQEKAVDGQNHSTIYIPSGSNGVPLVQTAPVQ